MFDPRKVCLVLMWRDFAIRVKHNPGRGVGVGETR